MVLESVNEILKTKYAKVKKASSGEFVGFPVKPQENYWQYPKCMDNFWHLLSPTENLVLNYIIRHTWGYGKITDRISMNQFIKGIKTKNGKYCDKGIGLSAPTVISATKKLEKMGFIVCKRTKGGWGIKSINEYQLKIEP